MYFLTWRTPKPRPRRATVPARITDTTAARIVPVSVNAVARAAVVEAATHILELATGDVLLDVTHSEAEAEEGDSTGKNDRDDGGQNDTGVGKH